MTIIDRIKVEREINFACGFCVPCTIEKVVLDGQDKSGTNALDHLPEGWSVLRTKQAWERETEELICPKHDINVGRAKDKQ